MNVKLIIIELFLFYIIIFPPEIYDISLSKFFILSALLLILFLNEILPSAFYIFIFLLLLVFLQFFPFYNLNINSIALFVVYVFLIFALKNLLNKKKRETLIKALIILILILTFYSFYQYFYGYAKDYATLSSYKSDYLINKILIYLQNKRITSTFTLPTTYAAFLLTSLPILILAINNFSKSLKYLAIIATISSCFSVILTQSFLIIPASIILFASFIFSKMAKVHKKFIFVFLLLFVLMLLALFILRKDYSFDLKEFKTITLHLGNWRIALKMINQHLLWGVGLGNFHLYYPYYMTKTDIETKFAHNLFLQIGAETGILGLLSSFFLVFILLFTLFKIYIQRKIDKESWAYSTATIVYVIYSIVDISAYFPSIGIFGCFIISLYLSLFEEEKEAENYSPLSFSFQKILSILILLGFIIYGCRIYIKEKLLLKSLEALNQKDYIKSEIYAKEYRNYFPYDLSSGLILFNISQNSQFSKEKKLIFQSFLAEKYPYSPRINYLLGIEDYQIGFFYNAFINFAIAKSLYPINNLYNQAYNNSLSYIKKLNENEKR